MPLLNATSIPYTGVPTVSTPPDAGGQTQRIQADPTMFGALQGAAASQLGATLERTGDQFAQIAIQRQEIYNKLAVTEAGNNLTDNWNKTLFGDPNNPNDHGYYGTQGRQAGDEFPNARSKLDTAFTEARSRLQNPQQQLLFDAEMRRQRAYNLSTMGRHYDQEYKKYTNDTYTSEQKLATTGAASAGASLDYDRFNSSLATNITSIYKQGQANGWSQTTVDQKVSEARATYVKIWTESLAANDHAADAETFLKNNVDAIGGVHGLEYPELLTRIRAAAADERFRRARAGEKPTYTPPGTVSSGPAQPAIESEAKAQGADVNMVTTIASLESGMGTNLGSRGNIFQLGSTEWANSGGGSMGDQATQIRNGVTFIKNTERALTTALGRNPTPAEVYLAHQQGVAGATALMNNPNEPAGNIVPPQNISANGGDPRAPASQFIAKWRQNYERASGSIKSVEPPKVSETPTVPSVTPTKISGIPANLRAVGDSLSAQLINSGVAGAVDKPFAAAGQPITPGTSAGGSDQPDRILARMKGLPDDFYKGNTIFLTSGSNMPSKISYVGDQIALARSKGAQAVIVPALGPGIKTRAYANQVLRYFAAEKGAIFFEPNIEWDKEGIHPKNATEVAKFRQQGLDALAAAKGPPT